MNKVQVRAQYQCECPNDVLRVYNIHPIRTYVGIYKVDHGRSITRNDKGTMKETYLVLL